VNLALRWLVGLLAVLALGGCVASLAASAVGMAVREAQPDPKSNEALQPVARQACSDRAAPHGAVHVIDVEQRKIDRIIVWGTVDDGRERRSFECGFTTRITYFRLRPIRRR